MDNRMKSKKTNIKHIGLNVKYAIRLLKKTSHGKNYILLRVISMLWESIVPLALMIIPGLIINELSSNNNNKISNLIVFVSILCLYPLLNHVKELSLGLYLIKIEKKITRECEMDLLSYISDMDYSSLESPEITVQTNRILNNAPHAPIDIFNYIINFGKSVIGAISIVTIISYLDPFILLFLVLFVIVNFFVNKKKNSLIYKHGIERSKLNNYYWSEFDNLSNPSNGKEIRSYGIKDFFIKRVNSVGSKLDSLEYQKNKKIQLVNTITVVIGALQQALLYIFPICRVLFQNMEIGTMTIFISAGNKFSSCINGITKNYLDISTYCMHIDEIKKFMDMPSLQSKGGTDTPFFRDGSTIEFKNVSFAYPGSKSMAINNINLRIPCNKKICIVGENGSGKSTLIKLLLGLYDPTSGAIYLDNIDIKRFDRKKYLALFAPVFQDYSKYNLPLSLNIALEERYNNDKIKESLKKSGLFSLIKKLSNGLSTYVGKKTDESGFEPSGGEGQKIAIARAIYHDCPIYILDEPTAALDPIAEYEIYSTFNQVIKNRTTVFTTHRMSAVKLTDILVVLQDGRIIEYGTHTELYAKGGKYREMFDKQAQFYVNANHDDKKDDPINQTSNN